ncbi:Glutamate receptor ionotropic, delta-2 [Nymphon striatum]|nr:Glutamate receptor ionotropic, delta-2 [Nymphon striatum]
MFIGPNINDMEGVSVVYESQSTISIHFPLMRKNPNMKLKFLTLKNGVNLNQYPSVLKNVKLRKEIKEEVIKIVTIHTAKYVIIDNKLPIRISGIFADILECLKQDLQINFDLHIVHDLNYGVKLKNGSWNGMIGELIDKNSSVQWHKRIWKKLLEHEHESFVNTLAEGGKKIMEKKVAFICDYLFILMNLDKPDIGYLKDIQTKDSIHLAFRKKFRHLLDIPKFLSVINKKLLSQMSFENQQKWRRSFPGYQYHIIISAYELAIEPPSLFRDGLMRKSPKSALAQLLRSKTPLESRLPDDATYIVDGGYLLRVVIWPPNSTYGEICESYVSYTLRHYGNEAIVVFDGYESAMSTKSAEQKRRATKSSSRDIMIDESMSTVTTQSEFLSNDANKTKLITMLVKKFNNKYIKTIQAIADADRLIVETAFLETGHSHPVVVIGIDTDILIMLTSLAPAGSDMYILCSINPLSLYNITLIQEAVGKKKIHLLFAHSVTGCDTTSALFGLEKKKAIALLDQYNVDNSLDVFISGSTTKEIISSVGEKFILKLYGAQKDINIMNVCGLEAEIAVLAF